LRSGSAVAETKNSYGGASGVSGQIGVRVWLKNPPGCLMIMPLLLMTLMDGGVIKQNEHEPLHAQA